MENTYWVKQDSDNPLFPNLHWSRPETKSTKGKLLIIGGNAHGFAVPAGSFSQSLAAGVGSTRVLLPDVLQKTVGSVFDVAEFAPSTPSGSFNQKALDTMLDLANWADGVLIAGELGRNAETSAVIEKFLSNTNKLVTITRDAVNNFNTSPDTVLSRQDTTLVLSLAQLQRLASEIGYSQALTFSMGLIRLVEWLHDFTKQYGSVIVIKHLDNIFVASKGQVSSTKLINDMKIWRVKVATFGTVWWLQNPEKPFEALTSAIYEATK